MGRLTRGEVVTIQVPMDKQVSTREIARQLGVTEGAVRYHQRRAAEHAKDGRQLQTQRAAGLAEAVDAWRGRMASSSGRSTCASSTTNWWSCTATQARTSRCCASCSDGTSRRCARGDAWRRSRARRRNRTGATSRACASGRGRRSLRLRDGAVLQPQAGDRVEPAQGPGGVDRLPQRSLPCIVLAIVDDKPCYALLPAPRVPGEAPRFAAQGKARRAGQGRDRAA